MKAATRHSLLVIKRSKSTKLLLPIMDLRLTHISGRQRPLQKAKSLESQSHSAYQSMLKSFRSCPRTPPQSFRQTLLYLSRAGLQSNQDWHQS